MPTVEPPCYPVINRNPSVAAIYSNYGLHDYGMIAAPTILSAIYGFYSGKPIRRPQMQFCGLLGFIAGGLVAYNNSSARLMGYRSNPNECARYGLEYPTKAQIPPKVWVVQDDNWYKRV
ncbi:hypothetical protein T492DRAFT_1076613 [Pavlovales sp. CCMP2436]|nr:hypothetical protein T492DRAFT_1076613 [Pavlovales sp. CCMP2436]